MSRLYWSFYGRTLFLKHSKCTFDTNSVSYLVHIISADGVSMVGDMVRAVVSWPMPRSAQGLRRFHGLAGYYRKFIQDFGIIAAPLTKLLKKEAFHWSPQVDTAFQALKNALFMAPVLQLPAFDKPFIVDCDAFGIGFCMVLHQGVRLLAFFSRPFAARHSKLAAYECELIGLVQAVCHCWPYQWGGVASSSAPTTTT